MEGYEGAVGQVVQAHCWADEEQHWREFMDMEFVLPVEQVVAFAFQVALKEFESVYLSALIFISD